MSERTPGARNGKQRWDQGIAMFGLLLAASVAAATVPDLRHWFLVPCLLSGWLLCSDAVRWARGELPLLSARGAVAAFGLYFFALAPPGHVVTNYWMRYVVPPDDWRDWLGGMACLNVIGLAVYRVVVSKVSQEKRRVGALQLDSRRAAAALGALFAICGGLQLSLLIRFGGLGGFIDALETRDPSLEGTGWMLALAEAVPILVVLAYALFVRTWWRARWGPLVLLVFLVFGLKVASGGLRGSRSSVVFAVVVAASIIHVWIRPIKRTTLLAAAVPGVVFIYYFGLYKAVGREALTTVTNSEQRVDIAETYGRTLSAALLGDLGRADVQAYLLYRWWEMPDDFPRAMGSTYLAGALSMIPRAILTERPLGKLLYGTNALYGQSWMNNGMFVATNIYGLSGELMINFGPWAVPVGFLVLAHAVKTVDRYLREKKRTDPRQLLGGGLIVSLIVLLASDIDNWLFFVLTQVLVVGVFVYFGSKRIVSNAAG